jgi:hypothetical protein
MRAPIRRFATTFDGFQASTHPMGLPVTSRAYRGIDDHAQSWGFYFASFTVEPAEGVDSTAFVYLVFPLWLLSLLTRNGVQCRSTIQYGSNKKSFTIDKASLTEPHE